MIKVYDYCVSYGGCLCNGKCVAVPLPSRDTVILLDRNKYNHALVYLTDCCFYWYRAMEKDNKKMRDTARKKYIETVRALAEYVRRRDVRVMRMEAERKKKTAMEAELREEKR